MWPSDCFTVVGDGEAEELVEPLAELVAVVVVSTPMELVVDTSVVILLKLLTEEDTTTMLLIDVETEVDATVVSATEVETTVEAITDEVLRTPPPG